jgi:hypothetical protein
MGNWNEADDQEFLKPHVSIYLFSHKKNTTKKFYFMYGVKGALWQIYATKDSREIKKRLSSKSRVSVWKA